MSKFKSNLVPLEVDVWNVIEDELSTGLIDVLDLRFDYSAEKEVGAIKIRHPENSRISTKHIKLDKKQSEDLIIQLSTRFNFHWTNLAELRFELEPGKVPIFTSRFYPRVSDESTLDTTKSRMNPITID
ncbi:hypothetical protein FQ087_18330 [Sporosarcina sp. ANT_H38]|uniref:hypothetical protein n=1 Tax=Sporosarcina sp. ANT_H38 TaxID=2597358 RepID=UPI0011F3A3FE|nr:hypothetical protein [Sporosarcina sp. ANT_H38]KAA0944084.1 hypothetical protein FQ087_18330 [Sporosarcina sp. ANT_H38]